jgi:hypothetical protein
MNYKISKLQARYELASKQSVYDRMKALKIVPASRGEISSQALDELDKLNEFMKRNPGAKIWEFPRNTESTTSLSSGQLDKSSGQLDKSSGQLDNFSEMLQLVEAIARHFSSQDPLAKYKALEYAANHIIFLPTSKIRELTGVTPREISFKRGTFVFTKIENNKIGRESAWRVQMLASAFKS